MCVCACDLACVHVCMCVCFWKKWWSVNHPGQYGGQPTRWFVLSMIFQLHFPFKYPKLSLMHLSAVYFSISGEMPTQSSNQQGKHGRTDGKADWHLKKSSVSAFWRVVFTCSAHTQGRGRAMLRVEVYILHVCRKPFTQLGF